VLGDALGGSVIRVESGRPDDRARVLAEGDEAVASYRKIGDDFSVGAALTNLAAGAMALGDLDAARRYGEEARAAFAEVDSYAQGYRVALNELNLAQLALLMGNTRDAYDALARSLASNALGGVVPSVLLVAAGY